MYIDTHCHVSKEYYENIDEVINNAEKENVKKEVILSVTGGMLFNVIAEPIFSYIYYSLILGNIDKAASYLTLTKWITTSTNAVLTIIIASLLYFPLRKHINIK